MLYIEVKTLNSDSFTSAILSKEFFKCPETKIVIVFGLFCQVSNNAFSTCIPVMLVFKVHFILPVDLIGWWLWLTGKRRFSSTSSFTSSFDADESTETPPSTMRRGRRAYFLSDCLHPPIIACLEHHAVHSKHQYLVALLHQYFLSRWSLI